MIRREINPEVRTLDVKAGIVEYIASDESIDSQREIVRADGYRFDRFNKNSPLVDSHRYGTVETLLGKIIDFRVVGRKLIETAQYAIDVAENKMARLAFAMVQAGYLKAVSVGFIPEILITKVPSDNWPGEWSGAKILPANTKQGRPVWEGQMQDLGARSDGVDTIYVRQQQIELSVCVIGSNPNALAKSYKAGVLSDADLETISEEIRKRDKTVSKALETAAAFETQRQQAKAKFLDELQQKIKRI